MDTESEIAVIGGGMVGMAVAYGLVRSGHQVTVFDEGDRALRASRGNFGLVWVQSKGGGLLDYARWTRLSAQLWKSFADDLGELSDTDLELQQPGGLIIALSEEELDREAEGLESLKQALDGDYPYERLGHNALRELLPEIGPDVAGATYFPEDGHANPLHLLKALHTGFIRCGGRIVNGSSVTSITHGNDGFAIESDGHHKAQKVVLCAGLGNAKLAPMVGLDAPISPQRGQVLITERVKPFLNYPTIHVRQVGNGAIQIGDSHENVDLDDGTTPNVIAAIAKRAVRTFPVLETVRLVRSWGALRVLSADGFPIYDMSTTCPGASVVNCHSGITLAAVHARILAPWLGGGETPEFVESMSARRFQ